MNLLKTSPNYRIDCPTAVCRCSTTVRIFHTILGNLGICLPAFYCMRRLKEAFDDPNKQVATVPHILQVPNGDQVMLNTAHPNIKTFKKHCDVMIRFGHSLSPSLYIDNRGWLQHLQKFQVDVKFSYHEIKEYGFIHDGFAINVGLNSFTGECID